MKNEEVVKYVLGFLRENNTDGELFLTNFHGMNVEVLKGAVESLEHKETRGLGIRVFQDRKIGFSFTSNLTELGIKAVINRAAVNSRYTSRDAANVLPGIADIGDISYVVCYDSRQKAASLSEKIQIAEDIETYAKEYAKKNRKRMNTYARGYYERNKEKHITRVKDWQVRNPEKILAYNSSEKGKERNRLSFARYCKLNKGKMRQYYRDWTSENKLKQRKAKVIIEKAVERKFGYHYWIDIEGNLWENKIKRTWG